MLACFAGCAIAIFKCKQCQYIIILPSFKLSPQRVIIIRNNVTDLPCSKH